MLLYRPDMRWAEGRSSRFFGTDPMLCDRPARLAFSAVADRRRQPRLLHLLIDAGDRCPYGLYRIFPFFHSFQNIDMDRPQNLFSTAHNVDSVQSFAVPGPESGPCFVATRTSSSVAVLQTFTEILN